MTTRRTLILFAGSSALGIARAQNLPDGITLIVASVAGTTTDAIARDFSAGLREVLRSSTVVANIGGGGGRLAVQAVERAKPDGSTLLFGGIEAITAPNTLVPVASVAAFPFVLVAAKPTSLDALSKVKDGPTVEIFGYQAGNVVRHLKLKDAKVSSQSGFDNAILEMRKGRVDAILAPYPWVVDDVRAGRLNVVAKTYSGQMKELSAAPEIRLPNPAAGAGLLGLFAPKDTPQQVLSKLQQAAQTMVKSDRFQSAAGAKGYLAEYGDTAAFRKWIEVQNGAVPDSCKKRDTCNADQSCPRPCP